MHEPWCSSCSLLCSAESTAGRYSAVRAMMPKIRTVFQQGAQDCALAVSHGAWWKTREHVQQTSLATSPGPGFWARCHHRCPRRSGCVRNTMKTFHKKMRKIARLPCPMSRGGVWKNGRTCVSETHAAGRQKFSSSRFLPQAPSEVQGVFFAMTYLDICDGNFGSGTLSRKAQC